MSNNNFESIGGRPSVRISNRLARTFVYIDGFNIWGHLKTVIKNDPTWQHLKFCNLPRDEGLSEGWGQIVTPLIFELYKVYGRNSIQDLTILLDF